MYIEKQILSELIELPKEEFSASLEKVSAHSSKFTKQNTGVLSFIASYFKKYKKAPTWKIIGKQFPEFEFPEASGNFQYAYDELVEHFKQIQVSKDLSRMQEISAKKGIDAGMEFLREIATKHTPTTSKAADIDFVRESESKLTEMQKRLADKASTSTIKFGIPPIDDAAGGFSKSDYIVLYALPKAFKTWLLCRLFVNYCELGYNPLIFSKEMTFEQIFIRTLFIAGQLDWNLAKTLDIPKKDKKYLQDKIKSFKSTGKIISKSDGEIMDLSFISRKIAENPTSDIVLIDGIYLMAKDPSDWKQQMNLSIGVRDLALTHNKLMVVTMQGNRQNDVAMTQEFERDCTAMYKLRRAKDDATGLKLPKSIITNPFAREFDEGFVVNGQHVGEMTMSIDFSSTYFHWEDKDLENLPFNGETGNKLNMEEL